MINKWMGECVQALSIFIVNCRPSFDPCNDEGKIHQYKYEKIIKYYNQSLLSYCRKCSMSVSEWVNLLFNVTINDISVIYVTTHRCAGGLKKELDLRSGSHAIDIS